MPELLNVSLVDSFMAACQAQDSMLPTSHPTKRIGSFNWANIQR
jgi:hypothetical protein